MFTLLGFNGSYLPKFIRGFKVPTYVAVPSGSQSQCDVTGGTERPRAYKEWEDAHAAWSPRSAPVLSGCCWSLSP